MDVIFVGRFIPERLLKTVVEDSHQKMGFSNHNFEMSIINGLCLQQDVNVKCVSVPGVYSFPYNNKRLFTKSERYYYNNGKVYAVGFCNLPILKEMISTISLSVLLLKEIFLSKSEKVDVIVNTPNYWLLSAVRFSKLLTKKIITQTVIIPDIPVMVSSMDKHNYIKRILLNILHSCSMKKTSTSNGLVLLTEEMMDFINKPVRHIVMEGIVDVVTMDKMEQSHDEQKKIILYTGTLREIFGVMNLVKAFKYVKDPDAELWLCGSGDSSSKIEAAARVDSRIKYWGLVDSKQALKMQRKATILVNPRTKEGEYTKYSFPSKTMEYLLSGKSVIINRLPGIPEEYYNYVYTPQDESVRSLAECINAVLKMNPSERERKSLSGRQFVLLYKNSKIQTMRILDMIRQY